MTKAERPHNLPLWRRFYRAESPDGRHVAQIDPAYEVSMGNPTSGMLCISSGPHIERCNPCFIWSDDSRYLAVPQFFLRWGFFRRQRLLIVAFEEKRVFVSDESTHYFQPESFSHGRLLVTTNPFNSARVMTFKIPAELSARFGRTHVRWPEAA
jgi:hypothetical protein